MALLDLCEEVVGCGSPGDSLFVKALSAIH